MKISLIAMTLAPIVLACSVDSSGPVSSLDGGAGGSGAAAAFSCTYDDDCPEPYDQSVCIRRACTRGVCGFWYATAGHAEPEDVLRGDCAKMVCDGAGKLARVEDPTDTRANDNVCMIDTCDGFAGLRKPAPEGQACDGGACDGAGECVTADTPSQCLAAIVACSEDQPCFNYLECMYCEDGPHYSSCCDESERICESYLDISVACTSELRPHTNTCDELRDSCGATPHLYDNIVANCPSSRRTH
jgi:hypothetical protein